MIINCAIEGLTVHALVAGRAETLCRTPADGLYVSANRWPGHYDAAEVCARCIAASLPGRS